MEGGGFLLPGVVHQAMRWEKNKSSEVMQGSFVSASSSRLTLARPALATRPCGVLRAIFAWAPGSPPTGKTYPALRNSILPLTVSSRFSSTSTLL